MNLQVGFLGCTLRVGTPGFGGSRGSLYSELFADMYGHMRAVLACIGDRLGPYESCFVRMMTPSRHPRARVCAYSMYVGVGLHNCSYTKGNADFTKGLY